MTQPAHPSSTATIGALPRTQGAMALETVDLSKHFGSFTALNQVNMQVAAGSVHALLGENGAGKSTLVKCVAGFQRADQGSILLDGREHDILSPTIARELGIGMVYQHFTLAPGMTVAENLLLAAGKVPAIIQWKKQRAALQDFLETTPFKLDLDARPADLSAGEKQKLELLKQLYLQPRLLILDEPTSVLTPQEADEVLGHVRAIARNGQCTVIMITHKFREVMAYTDSVTVLRKGQAVHHCNVADTDPDLLASAMMGNDNTRSSQRATAKLITQSPVDRPTHTKQSNTPALRIKQLQAMGDRGILAVHKLSLDVHPGEIVGVAGISGNGQRELVEALVGQRKRIAGTVEVNGQPYQAKRAQNHQLKVRSLPEEPLQNACVAEFSVAENMALRDFDHPPLSWNGLLHFARWRERAKDWIASYGIKTQGVTAPMQSLSGGNVQRAVLARELAGSINVLIASNPVFGLDFAAVEEIHNRILQVRNNNGAVLLLSEDLDELLELSDRIVVMSEGRIVFETPVQNADRQVLGAHMGGGHNKEIACN